MNDIPQPRFGTYETVEQVRRSSTSVIYKGYQQSLDRTVAIKVLYTHDPQFVARFKREAQSIGQLEHTNILPVYDYGEQDGQLYFVMQYVEQGFTVADLFGEPVAPIYALELMLRLLDALDYAHGRGVLHRDIKPSNILLPLPNWPILADFWIAQEDDGQQSQTMPNLVFDSAHYMAPEHAEGRPVDARTDLYSLGVVLYHLVVGRVPFEAKTPVGVLQKHAYAPLPPPRSLRPELPEALEQVLERALAKSPDERYPHARAMAADLRQVLATMARTQQSGAVGVLYTAGMQALGNGAWNEAVAKFDQAHALDPAFEHVAELLALAAAAQQRARSEGQALLARVQQHSSTQLRLNTPISRSPQGVPYQTLHLPLDKAATVAAPPASPPADTLLRRVRHLVIGLLIAACLLALLIVLLQWHAA